MFPSHQTTHSLLRKAWDSRNARGLRDQQEERDAAARISWPKLDERYPITTRIIYLVCFSRWLRSRSEIFRNFVKSGKHGTWISCARACMACLYTSLTCSIYGAYCACKSLGRRSRTHLHCYLRSLSAICSRPPPPPPPPPPPAFIFLARQIFTGITVTRVNALTAIALSPGVRSLHDLDRS